MKKKIGYFLVVSAIIISGISLGENASGKIRQANGVKRRELEEEKIVLVNRSLNDLKKRSSDVTVTYEGEALNTIEKDGKISVYKAKDDKSDIVAILKDYEKVELLETLPYGWFKVKLKSGQVGYVDARYIRADSIPVHNYDENSSEWVIKFSEKDQTIKIFKQGNIVLESLGSSGVRNNFTPKGVFQIEEGKRGEWSYVPRFEQGMKYWVGFKGSYLLHSIPYTEDGEVIEEEKEKLGEPSSHGCIRLPIDVAKYIYDNVPDGSIVIIE